MRRIRQIKSRRTRRQKQWIHSLKQHSVFAMSIEYEVVEEDEDDE